MYKELVNVMEDRLKSRDVIISTDFGEIENYSKHNKRFPLGFITPAPIRFLDHRIDISFRIYLLDKLNKSKFNTLDIMSSMESVAEQFIVDMNHYGIHKGYNINYNSLGADIQFYELDEECCGIVLNLIISVERDLQGNCDPYVYDENGKIRNV